MELKEIEKLLEKYFDAATSTAEENRLKDYFSSLDVAPHLEQYRPMFGYFTQQATEKFEKTVPLKPRKQYVAWLSVAASFVLMLGLYALFLTPQTPQEGELGTYDDPEVAFKETQKALNMLSSNINVGVTGAAYLGEYQKSKNKIFKEDTK
ncbi:hypothetical protein DVK85_13065 [Flavobacterium arcticum]|uniref:Uncharacterized protein n=1 Tax=Flavobacterium arcticum TaxID=1784713 RepID=A0A345HEU9_9FLAO|nr:hypothetical protein [Flavobacterium arcticum]AXG75109.1 hypothetical protein DVK85_13065 [Flavobacterium arcticum]KAF2511111.1 hypothetical protein E0W72_06880 [Flavobacterium arcticum]